MSEQNQREEDDDKSPTVVSPSYLPQKKEKNIKALISVIEKTRCSNSYLVKSNLAVDNCAQSKFADVLNNIIPGTFVVAQKKIFECDYADLICNDLHQQQTSLENTSDSDSASEGSSVGSYSDSYSDIDVQNVDEISYNVFQFTPEELQRLSVYATGCPLYQLYVPSCDYFASQRHLHCNECSVNSHLTNRSFFLSYHLSGNVRNLPSFRSCFNYVAVDKRTCSVESQSDCWKRTVRQADLVPCLAPTGSDTHCHCQAVRTATSSKPAELADHVVCPWLRNTHQLWDVGLSHAGSHKDTGGDCEGADHFNYLLPFPCQRVYLDLTGTDVSMSVYYHDSLQEDEDNRIAIPCRWFVTPTGIHRTSLLCSCPVCNKQVTDSPVYCFSLPLSYFNDSVLPKVAMVPPQVQDKFKTSTPPHRQWITHSHPDRTRPSGSFTVMCYNVLCDKYCTRQQYGYCPAWALSWEYRKKAILDDIRSLNADIISLQEVETDQFWNFFQLELGQDGYHGIFSPKSRARTMTEQERRHVDGCAIFFKRDKFRLLDEKLVEFNQLAMANCHGNDDMLNRVMTKDNIGLCALLETKSAVFEGGPMPPDPLTQQLLLVATAHIHWDPEFSDVKLVQTMMLMYELQNFVEETTHKYQLPYPGPHLCKSIPFVLCGDLNSLPESGVIEFLSNGKVATNHSDFKENMYEQVMSKMSNGDKEHIYHSFHLARAYHDVMPFTNYTYDFKGIIDYIFYSVGRLRVLGLLGPYDDEWFRVNRVLGCPHPHMPSDHFSLLVELEMPIQPPSLACAPPHMPGKLR